MHVQRTTWVENALPVKRFDHVAFPEILDMDPYVYHKRAARPASLELLDDNRKGLVGGKKHAPCNGYVTRARCELCADW